jgi:hypothetical protein
LSRDSGRRVKCIDGFCAPEQVDLRLGGGGETRAKGFEDQVDIYQLANLALALISAETVDGTKRSRDRVKKASGETEPLSLSDFVRQALELEPWRRPSTEEAVWRLAAEWRRRYSCWCALFQSPP